MFRADVADVVASTIRRPSPLSRSIRIGVGSSGSSRTRAHVRRPRDRAQVRAARTPRSCAAAAIRSGFARLRRTALRPGRARFTSTPQAHFPASAPLVPFRNRCQILERGRSLSRLA